MNDRSDRLCAYLGDLADNNNRTWFEQNRPRYERDWLDPAKAFVEAIEPIVTAFDPPHKAEARINGSIRRINRDVRFSKDKSPYDPRLHLVFWTGDHPNKSPAIHVVVHSDRLGMGVGQWAMGTAELERYRKAVVCSQSGQELVRYVEACRGSGFDLAEETLKRLPSGLEANDKRGTLLKRKGLVLTTGAATRSPTVFCDVAAVSKAMAALVPINRWLCKYVAG